VHVKPICRRGLLLAKLAAEEALQQAGLWCRCDGNTVPASWQVGGWWAERCSIARQHPA